MAVDSVSAATDHQCSGAGHLHSPCRSSKAPGPARVARAEPRRDWCNGRRRARQVAPNVARFVATDGTGWVGPEVRSPSTISRKPCYDAGDGTLGFGGWSGATTSRLLEPRRPQSPSRRCVL